MDCNEGPEVTALLTKIRNLEHHSKQLSRDKFDLEHRVRNLTRSLGFESLEQAENSQLALLENVPQPPSLINTDLKTPWNGLNALAEAEASIARHTRELQLLEADAMRLRRDKSTLSASLDVCRASAKEYELEKEAIRTEYIERLAMKDSHIAGLQKKLAVKTVAVETPEFKENCSQLSYPASRTSSSLAALSPLQIQYNDLQIKFSALVEEKNALQLRFTNSLTDWKTFKMWLLGLSTKRDRSISVSPKKKRRKTSHSPHHPRDAPGKNITEAERGLAITKITGLILKHEADSAADKVPSVDSSIECSPAAHRKRRWDQVDAHDMEVDSGELNPSLASRSHVSSPARPSRPSYSRGIPRAALPAIRKSPAPSTSTARAARHLSLFGDGLKPSSSPSLSVNPPPAPSSTLVFNSLPAQDSTESIRIVSVSEEPLSGLQMGPQISKDHGSSVATPTPRHTRPETAITTNNVLEKDVSSTAAATKSARIVHETMDLTSSSQASSIGGEPTQSLPCTTPARLNDFKSSPPAITGLTSKPATAQMHNKPKIPSPSFIESNTIEPPKPIPAATTGASSSKSLPKPEPPTHIVLPRHLPSEGPSMVTPKTRSELPSNLKRARVPQLLNFTEPRAYRQSRPAAHGGLGQEIPARLTGDQKIKGKQRAIELNEDSGTEVINRQIDSTLPSTKVQNYASSPAILGSDDSQPTSSKEKTELTTKMDVRPEPVIMTRSEREKWYDVMKKKPLSEYKKAYAPYKGHGRYASRNDNEDMDANINSRFEIDRNANDGMAQPYAEVVRDKETRRRMHAVDCPCCKDWYETVGPLPPKLQPPLWRTPSPSIVQSSQSPGAKSARRPRSASPASPSRRRREQDMQTHRQLVSRHRHHWAPPSTPPDYWIIGFPDTQQLAKINERARDMHASKRKSIEQEANKPDGKYKKKC